MRLFHITSIANAEAILKEGFRDATGYYITDQEWSGVWVVSEPEEQHLTASSTLFAIEVPEDVINEFEWAEEGKPNREWLIPAALLNSYGPPVWENLRWWTVKGD